MTSQRSLLTVEEVAEEFQRHPETVRKWARDGLISSIKLPGGERRFRRSDIEAIIRGEVTLVQPTSEAAGAA